MKLENQVVSLEIAKHLKQLCIKQKSLFYWSSFRNESSPKEQWSNVYDVIIDQEDKNEYRGITYLKDKKFYSAFTASELGELLPQTLIYDDCELILGTTKIIGGWCALYYEEKNYVPIDCKDSTLANAMGKMLIDLLEKNLITLRLK